MLTICLWAGMVSGAVAAQSEVFQTDSLSAQLIFAQDGVIQGAETLSAAVIVDLEPGWKTYWRSPGEVGLPPVLTFDGATNIEAVEILWPAPKRFVAFGIENFGYEERVIFPLRVQLTEAGVPAEANFALDLLVCSDICVPRSLDLAVSLPVSASRDTVASDTIAEALTTVPTDGLPSQISGFTAFMDEAGTQLTIEVIATRTLDTLDVFPELGNASTFGKPDIRFSQDRSRAWAQFPINYAGVESGVPLSVTVVERGGAVFTATPEMVGAAPPPPVELAVPGVSVDTILWYALIAVLGGLVLNVMPCVLPVLAIKVSSLTRNDASSQTDHRRGLLMTTLGILTFMWLLAGVLIVLKALGASIGWGIQFQNPAFLAVAMTILLLFAGNLFGVFEISLPSRFQTRMDRAGGSSSFGDFFTGFFAALLATPCSAPFLGTAVAFALAGRSVDIVIVFTALGLGLALPYLALAASPRLARALPKPGRWMIWVKWGVGALLVGTVVWLAWVMIGVAGWPITALTLGAGLVLLALLQGSRHIANHPVIATLTVVFALVLTIQMRPQQELAPIVIDDDLIAWSTFERAAIARAVSRGHVVFVDVTADWCVTCKANKVLVLERDPVRSTLNGSDVVALQADWTRPDEAIARFLEDNNRYGIPFNAVYGPNAPNGIILPEVLTASAVMDAIQRAELSNLQERLFQLTNSSFNP